MDNQNELIVLRGKNCRRSQRIIAWLEAEKIPFSLYEMDTPEGQQLAKNYNVLASPGLIKAGRVINPFDILQDCRVNETAARQILMEENP